METSTDENGIYSFTQAPGGAVRLVVDYHDGEQYHVGQMDLMLQVGWASRKDVELGEANEAQATPDQP